MKNKRFSVEQIVAVMKQAEAGVPVAELIRKVGISEQTSGKWRTRDEPQPCNDLPCMKAATGIGDMRAMYLEPT